MSDEIKRGGMGYGRKPISILSRIFRHSAPSSSALTSGKRAKVGT